LLGRLRASGALLAALDDRGDDLRNHVPGAHDDDLIPFAHVLPGEILLVVEGGGAHRHAADMHRLEHRARQEGTGPPHVPDDLVELRGGGRRGELPSHRPARLPPGDPELALQPAIVHLDDYAVDLEVEGVAAALPPATALRDLVYAVENRDVVVDLESALAQPLERLRVARGLPAPQGGDAVAPDREGPGGGERGNQLPQRAGGSVARVCEGRLPLPRALLVHPGEAGDRQVDLAADLDQLRSVLDRQRDRLDRLQVLRDVLPHPPVTPGGAPGEHTAL